MALFSRAAARRHPFACYCAMTFGISWAGALGVMAPALARHERASTLQGILIFPAMLLGPFCAGLIHSGTLEGRAGLRLLAARLNPRKIPGRWWLVLCIPPGLVLAVLFALSREISQVFSPNFFAIGILFGIPAGLMEEVGWTGLAFQQLSSRRSALGASLWIGMVWSCWHLPAINFLGAAVPHGAWWPTFFLAFAMAMTAMRVLIGWAYVNSRSVLLAQLIHVSSTGSLVVFSPAHASPAQEAGWYAAYGLVLWGVVLAVVLRDGPALRCPPIPPPERAALKQLPVAPHDGSA